MRPIEICPRQQLGAALPQYDQNVVPSEPAADGMDMLQVRIA